MRYLNLPDHLQREDLLEMLLARLDGMVYRCRADEHWTMEFISGGCTKLTGYRPSEILYNSRVTYEEIIHPLDRSYVRQEIYSAMRKKQSFNLEYRICHADGSIRWVWERGALVTGEESEQSNVILQGFVEDVTQRHLQGEALAEAENRYRSIFENATEGIFQTTESGYYLAVNPALAKIYGYDSPNTLMYTLSNIQQQLYVDASRREEFTELMYRQGQVKDFESRVRRRDGSIIWISENAHVVRDQSGRLLYYEGTVVDISERKELQKRISHQATHDSLTNLPNRVLLIDRIERACRAAHRDDEKLAVLFLDLDNFKKINDSLGNSAGDLLLKEISQRLLSCVRESDTVARIGGDEFVLLLPGIQTDSDLVSHVVQRVLELVQQPCDLERGSYSVTCSVGISLYPDDAQKAESLLKYADMAMYRAKQAGSSNFQFFTESLHRSVIEALEVEQDLRNAITQGDLELHYQPQVCVSTGKILGAEALVRWRSAEKGLIPPGQFIPVAEKTGLVAPLGKWVLESVCQQLKSWSKHSLSLVPISINISPKQFNDPGLVESIRRTLEKYELDPQWLKIEITENCIAQDQKRFSQTLEELNRLGLKTAVDDFGSGYSNIQSLRTIEVATLKIDQSFVSSLDNEKHRAIYGAVVSMAHNLNFQVVAEGVETQEQFDFLRSVNCDVIQGFYFDAPLVAQDFSDVMSRGTYPLKIEKT